MIYVNCTHSPKESPLTLSCAATMRRVVEKSPGFPGYILHNPDQPGSSGEGMGYPYEVNGKDWKEAFNVCGNLWPRIGGAEPHDLPPRDGPIATLMDKFRPSKGIVCDFTSSNEAVEEAVRYQRIINENNQIFISEANAKQPHIVPDANTWIAAEWFLWDIKIPGSVNGWKPRRWKIEELLALPDTKILVEVTSETRRGLGFPDDTCPDWATAKLTIAEAFHNLSPSRMIVSVRTSDMLPSQIDHLRSLNQ